MQTADAVVIGGGVIGTSIAYRLAQQGRKTILLEKGALGAATSGACDKGVYLQSKKPGIHLELAKESRKIYEQLEDELGVSVEFNRSGGMIVIETEEQLEIMKTFTETQRMANIPIQLLNRNETLKMQPILSRHVVGATWCSEDAEVNPLLLTVAFAEAASRHRAKIMKHIEVVGITCTNGKVTEVITTKGAISTEIVVNAAGPFSPVIGEMVKQKIPIIPRRGVILISEKVAPLVRGSLLCAQYIASKHRSEEQIMTNPYGIGLSLGQTQSGNLLIGGSREFAGFDQEIRPEIIEAIASHAMRIVPELGRIRVIRTMVGFRPSTSDGLPIISRVSEVSGYFIAAGHEGDGIALAPITGKLVADLVEGGNSYAHLLKHLSLSRFQSNQQTST